MFTTLPEKIYSKDKFTILLTDELSKIEKWESPQAVFVEKNKNSATFIAPEVDKDTQIQIYGISKNYTHIINLEIKFKGIYYFTRSYRPFSDGKWFIDSDTKIAMGKDPGDFKYRFHAEFDLEKEKDWKGEFFCAPDTIISTWTDDNNFHTTSYSDYLLWNRDTYLSTDNKTAIIGIKRSSKDPVDYIDIPNDRVNEVEKNVPPLDIAVENNMTYGNPLILNTIYITNKHTKPINVFYAYQDAAYMWFPDSTQENVDFIFFPVDSSDIVSTEADYGESVPGLYFFAGLIHKKINILGGVFCPSYGSLAATLPCYIGNYMFPCEKDFNIDSHNDYRYESVKNYLNKLRGKIPFDYSQALLRNRLIGLTFSHIQPGETVMDNLYRVMLYYPEISKPFTPLEWKQKVFQAIGKRRVPK
jgi:hypothetical protein